MNKAVVQTCALCRLFPLSRVFFARWYTTRDKNQELAKHFWPSVQLNQRDALFIQFIKN
jgi:hypothetical protein